MRSHRQTQPLLAMRRARAGRAEDRDRNSPLHTAVLELQRWAGNRAVAELMQPGSPAPATMVAQRDLDDGGQAGEAPLEPAAGEIVQPDLGEAAGGEEPVAAETNEFGEMDGSIATGVAPHTFLNKGQVAKGKWHHAGGSGGKGNEGVGSADLVAPKYNSPRPRSQAATPRPASGRARAR